MNINKISMAQSPAFSARVTINAPETLLKKEEKAYFESLGSKIGTPKDVFEITISDLKPSKFDDSQLVYNCKQSYKEFKNGEFYTKSSSIDIPYVKDGKPMQAKSPSAYLERIFARKMK